MSWFQELNVASLLLALTPGAVPIEMAHWYHFHDPDVALLGQSGLSREFEEPQSPFRMSQLTMITRESAVRLLTAYRVLRGETN